jgi:hypothetical protein
MAQDGIAVVNKGIDVFPCSSLEALEQVIKIK